MPLPTNLFSKKTPEAALEKATRKLEQANENYQYALDNPHKFWYAGRFARREGNGIGHEYFLNKYKKELDEAERKRDACQDAYDKSRNGVAP